MKLPGNAIGISDLNGHRECPRRMSFQMKRWTEEGEPPEAEGPNTAYGSAIHHAIFLSESEMATDEEAIQGAVNEYGRWLDAEDTELLEKDMETYHQRDFAQVRTVAVEGEFRVPLLEHEGETIYFRGTIDRLYERLDAPGHYLHIDYKSSKWRKTEEEVHKDTQLWSYNWMLHEVFPEIEKLTQFYDQLRYGVVPTRKTDAQRRQIKKWLKRQVRRVLEDEDWQDDGLLAPTFNQWCPWCQLLESCSEPLRTSEFAVARIAALAPENEQTGKLDLDPDLIEQYISEAENAATLRKALERFEKSVQQVIKDMPLERRTYHGYGLSGREFDVWTPEGLRAAHGVMGEEFYSLVKITKGRINEFLDKEDERKVALLDLALKEGQTPSVKKL